MDYVIVIKKTDGQVLTHQTTGQRTKYYPTIRLAESNAWSLEVYPHIDTAVACHRDDVLLEMTKYIKN